MKNEPQFSANLIGGPHDGKFIKNALGTCVMIPVRTRKGRKVAVYEYGEATIDTPERLVLNARFVGWKKP